VHLYYGSKVAAFARHHTMALSPLGLRTGDLDLAVENCIKAL
jgi:hypothetical protein